MIKQGNDRPDYDIKKNMFTLVALCNSNVEQQIRFSVWDKTDRMINAVYTTIS